jgi:hypothetical protein
MKCPVKILDTDTGVDYLKHGHHSMNASSASTHTEGSLLSQDRVIHERSTASFWACPPYSSQRRAIMSTPLAPLRVFCPWTGKNLRNYSWRHAHVAEENASATPRPENLVSQLGLFVSIVHPQFDHLEAGSGCVPGRLLVICLRRL